MTGTRGTTRPSRGISAAAAVTGVPVDTLRYYEREGLIGPVDRDAAGRRRYTDDDIAWIGIVTCLRTAGLGIDDLRQFTRLLRSHAEPTDRVGFLRARHDDLTRRVAQLEAALRVLEDKIAYFSEPG